MENVTYSTVSTRYASVNANGEVQGIKEGRAKIKVKGTIIGINVEVGASYTPYRYNPKPIPTYKGTNPLCAMWAERLQANN